MAVSRTAQISLAVAFFGVVAFILGVIAENKKQSAMAIPAETKFHVLVVDDSLIDMKLIERLLKTSSCQVTVVDLGSKALEFLGIHGEQGTSPSGSSECQLSMKEYFQAFPDGKLQRTFGMIWR